MTQLSQYSQEIQTDEVRKGFDPDAQSYLSFAMSAYLEHTARQATSMGHQAVSGENYRQSRKFLMDAIKLDPRSSFLYVKLSENSILLGDMEEAKLFCKKALELDPFDADAHYLLGYLKYRADQDKNGAVKEFKMATELNPRHFKAQLYLAALSFEFEDYDQSASSYSELVKLRPYDPDLRYRLGVSYMESGEIAKAIDELRSATMLREDYLEAHFHLANLYARQSRNREAIEQCQIILKRVPEDPSVNLLLAQLYVGSGEFDKATALCQELLERWHAGRKTVLAETYYRLASAYKGKGESALADENFQRAIDVYKSILETEEKQGNFGINYDIALVYDAKGDYALAEKHLLRLIELRPDEPNAYNYLGYMLVERNKDLNSALSYIRKAVEMEPKNGAFRDSLGWAYFKLGHLDDACVELERAAELIPDDSDIHEHLGEVYLKKGGEFTQRAIQEWEKALQLKPSKSSLRQKLNELYKLTGKFGN